MEHKIAQEGVNPFYNICGTNFPNVMSTKSLDMDEYWKYCGDYYEKITNTLKKNLRNLIIIMD